MFPAGRPGWGLLLLRTVVGITFIIQGITHLTATTDPGFGTRAIGLLAVLISALLLVGFLTPVAAVFVGLVETAAVLSWVPSSFEHPGDPKLSSLLMIGMAAALILLGPGGFSLDARLFGRREIIIPPTTRTSPK